MDDVFRYGARLTPALRMVSKFSELEQQAIGILLAAGEPADRLELLKRAWRRKSAEPDDDARVAEQLLNPRNEREWSLIRELLWGSGKESRWVLDSVVQTLRLTGGRRSEELLLTARSHFRTGGKRSTTRWLTCAANRFRFEGQISRSWQKG